MVCQCYIATTREYTTDNIQPKRGRELRERLHYDKKWGEKITELLSIQLYDANVDDKKGQHKEGQDKKGTGQDKTREKSRRIEPM